jgi:hypothetical protein
MISECWIGEDAEGSGRGLICCTLPAIARMDYERPRKTSAWEAGLKAGI